MVEKIHKPFKVKCKRYTATVTSEVLIVINVFFTLIYIYIYLLYLNILNNDALCQFVPTYYWWKHKNTCIWYLLNKITRHVQQCWAEITIFPYKWWSKCLILYWYLLYIIICDHIEWITFFLSQTLNLFYLHFVYLFFSCL